MKITSNENGPLVLLVDDQIYDLEINTIALQEADPTVRTLTFDEGEDALDYIRALPGNGEQPGLMLLDLNMPNMSGHEVLETIQNEGLKHFPILILSSSSLPEDFIRSRQLGADACFEKPISLEDNIKLFEKIIASYLDDRVSA